MKAVRISEYGGPEKLNFETNVPIPEPTDDEVLIKVSAIGVNPVDTYIREGWYPMGDVKLPFSLGSDVAGVIEATGKNVERFKKSDRVFTILGRHGTNTGGYSEYVAVEEIYVGHLGRLSFEQGACIGIPYYTAVRAVITRAKITSNDEFVLIHGASGGVGMAAIDVIKSIEGVDAEIIGTAGSVKGIAAVKDKGADFVFNHNREGYMKDIKKTTNGKGVDVILEMLANVNLPSDLEVSARGARIIVVGCRGEIAINPRVMMAKELNVLGVMLKSNTAAEWETFHGIIEKAIENKLIKPVVYEEYELKDAAKAHIQIMQSSGACGNIILKT